jgi:hypothetical protein
MGYTSYKDDLHAYMFILILFDLSAVGVVYSTQLYLLFTVIFFMNILFETLV